MAQRPSIGSLWMGGPLSYFEQLSLVSYRDAGHSVVLFSYDDVENLPDGIAVSDAADVLPLGDDLQIGSQPHVDRFRYMMLQQNDGMIWSDLDVYCHRPFDPTDGHFFGWGSREHISGSILALPKDCAALSALVDFTSDPFAIPTFYGDAYRKELKTKQASGAPVDVVEQPRGVWGPHAITHFLTETGDDRHALSLDRFQPVSFRDRAQLLKRGVDFKDRITDQTLAIHLHGRRLKTRLADSETGVPPYHSLLGRLLAKHKIDPAQAPIVEGKTFDPDADPIIHTRDLLPISPAARQGRGQLNLSDLADRFGSAKGSTQNRLAELYHMLFMGMRDAPVRLLELGLQDGGPEIGGAADRVTTDLPSVRMWLEYFVDGTVHGVDVSDFSWFQHPRFRFHQLDLENGTALADAVAQDAPFDIIIDDASHASHHQQGAFQTLFPRLKSGGIYVIEGLRSQPDHIELDESVKTSDLFQSYIRTGIFEHTDPMIASAFNGIRTDISGCFAVQAEFVKANRDLAVVVHKR